VLYQEYLTTPNCRIKFVGAPLNVSDFTLKLRRFVKHEGTDKLAANGLF
jgi:hypothetical protein